MSEKIQLSPQLGTEIPNTSLAFLWYAIRPSWKLYVLAIIFVTLASAIGQSSSYLFKLIIEAVEANDYTYAFWLGMSYPAVIFIVQVLYRGSGVSASLVESRAGKFAYDQLVFHLLQHSKGYFSDRFAGSLVNKTSNVIRGMTSMSEYILWTYLDIAVTFIVTFIFIVLVNIWAGFIFLSLILLLLVINKFMTKKKRTLSSIEADATSKLSGSSVDIFNNIDAVRQYSRFLFEKENIGRATEHVKVSALRSWWYSEAMLLVNGVVILSAFASIMYAVMTGWVSGVISTGDVVLVLALLSQITGTLLFVGQSFQNAARAFGEIDEGLSEIIVPHEVTDVRNAESLLVPSGEILWQAVSFNYGQNKVFSDFNLTIKPGQRVGLVGPSGAGKTTFVSLLLRQHDLAGGEILIDGQNIAEVTQDSLRENIAVVPQEPLLFHRTISENIAYGKLDATDEEIIEVARKAQAHDFISSLEKGYDTLVGERGVKLSGGQKQRVAIARAMLKDAPILVLDEATSALDSESEVAIQKALHFLMAGKTVIAIAHRLSTLREMDRIIVMENGKVVEDGNHELLAKAGGTYQRLWEHQAGGFLQE